MASFRDSFLDLERHRRILEENVEKLRQSLLQWQLWEAEYEALKEEVHSLPAPAGRADLARIRGDFDGQVVTQREVDEIFGAGGASKSAEQIANVLERRIDYVSQNVGTLERQVEAAEHKLAAAMVVSDPDVRHEDGEAVTDIVERLDEEGNVVSYHLQTAGDAQPQILEALEKAGIKDLPDFSQKKLESEGGEEEEPEASSTESARGLTAAATAAEDEPERPGARKSVSFAEDTKPGHEEEGPEAPMSRTAKRLEAIMHQAKELERPSAEPPVIPQNESEEDAELRREMLRYGMSEIAPIVAELEIEEEGNSDEQDYDDYDDEDEMTDEDDKYGLSKYSVIDDEYRKRMLELEERLGFKPSRPDSDRNVNGVDDTQVPEEGIGRISIVEPAQQDKKSSISASRNGLPKKAQVDGKGVRFADNLDIAPDKSDASQPETPSEPQVDPLSDVVERTSRLQVQPDQKPKKASRFKKDRQGEASSSAAPTNTMDISDIPRGPADAPSRFLDQDIRTAPTGPDGQTIADAVIERDISAGAKEPDEFDATLLHQEAAVEYHRMRNRLIQKDGGFMKEDESPILPLDEEEGGPKRMSKFKAARLSRQ